MKNKKYWLIVIALLLIIGILVFVNFDKSDDVVVEDEPVQDNECSKTNSCPVVIEKTPYEEFINNLPEYESEGYIEINNGVPFFTEEEIDNYYESPENYFYLSDLDQYGRAGVAVAKITPDSLCFESRTESMASLKPAGFQTTRYDDLIEDKYLYNRCHLIMRASYQSAANTDVIENLVTGTRYMNINELATEEEAVEYVKVSEHPLLYRATPIYEGSNLIPSGILLEGYGHGSANRIYQFCIYYFNVQPGINIDYSTGDNWRN